MFGDGDVGETVNDDDDESDDGQAAHSGDPSDTAKPQDSVTATPPPPQSERSGVSLSPTLWRGSLNLDSDSSSDSEQDESEREWEGWARDLPRQRSLQAREEELHIRQLERDIQVSSDMDEVELEVPWVQDWDATGSSEDAARGADGNYASHDSSRDTASGWAAAIPGGPVLPSQHRVLTSYSSADSLIRRTMRSTPARLRPRIFESTSDSSPRVRPRSPLSSQVTPATSEASLEPVLSSASRSALPLRMPIPINMRMSSMRTSNLSISVDASSHSLADGLVSPRSTSGSGHGKRPKGKDRSTQGQGLKSSPDTKRKGNSADDRNDSGLRPAASSRNLLRPAKLKLSLPTTSSRDQVPVTETTNASSSPSSLESITFVAPDSDSE